MNKKTKQRLRWQKVVKKTSKDRAVAATGWERGSDGGGGRRAWQWPIWLAWQRFCNHLQARTCFSVRPSTLHPEAPKEFATLIIKFKTKVPQGFWPDIVNKMKAEEEGRTDAKPAKKKAMKAMRA